MIFIQQTSMLLAEITFLAINQYPDVRSLQGVMKFDTQISPQLNFQRVKGPPCPSRQTQIRPLHNRLITGKVLLLLSYVWSAHVNELTNTKHETSSTFKTGLAKGRFFTETETVGYQDITRFGMAHKEVIFIHCSSKKRFIFSLLTSVKRARL